MGDYATNKRWRLRHPGKWKRWKRKYYGKHAINCPNKNRAWSEYEIALIVSEDRFPDSFISKLLGRSVRAVQQKKHYLLNGRPDRNQPPMD